jgi:hypothetical protein
MTTQTMPQFGTFKKQLITLLLIGLLLVTATGLIAAAITHRPPITWFTTESCQGQPALLEEPYSLTHAIPPCWLIP